MGRARRNNMPNSTTEERNHGVSTPKSTMSTSHHNDKHLPIIFELVGFNKDMAFGAETQLLEGAAGATDASPHCESSSLNGTWSRLVGRPGSGARRNTSA